MIADFIILILVLITIYSGWRRGLLFALFNLVFAIFSFVIAWLLMVPAARLIGRAPFLSPLAVQIGNRLLEPVLKSSNSLLENIINLNLPEPLKIFLVKRFPENSGSFSELWQDISASVFRTAVTAGIFIVFFTLLFVFVHAMIRKLSGIANHIPVLGTANRVGGVLVNLVIFFVILNVLLFALAFVVPVSSSLENLLDKSYIVHWFYESEFWHKFLDIIFS